MLYPSQLNNILIHRIVLLGIYFANYDMCLYTYLYMCMHALVRVDEAEVWVSCARCEPKLAVLTRIASTDLAESQPHLFCLEYVHLSYIYFLSC